MAQASEKYGGADDAKTPIRKKRSADREMAQAFLSSLDKDNDLPTLSPRKEIPYFRMVDLDENDSKRIVGMRIKVYWPDSRKWFSGTINSFDDEKRVHKINYDDGDKEELDLSQERFELEIKSSDGFRVKPVLSHSMKQVKKCDGDKAIAELLLEKSSKAGKEEILKKHSELKKNKVSKKAMELDENDESDSIADILRKAKTLMKSTKVGFFGESLKLDSDEVLNLPPSSPETPVQEENAEVVSGTLKPKNSDTTGDVPEERESGDNETKTDVVGQELGLSETAGSGTVDLLLSEEVV